MDASKLTLSPMTREQAQEIAAWRYDGEYAFYNRREEFIPDFIESLLDGDHYACTDENRELIGYFCFGAEARVPTVEENVYDDDALDVGLGMRPDLCGHGFGLDFVLFGIHFAREVLGARRFRLSVAAFNLRAKTVYERAGFRTVREVTNSYFKNKFSIMTLN